MVPGEEEDSRPRFESRVGLGGETALAFLAPPVPLVRETVRVEVVAEEDDERALRVLRGLRGESPQERLFGSRVAGVPHEEKRLDTLGERARRSLPRTCRLEHECARREHAARNEDARETASPRVSRRRHRTAARASVPFAGPRAPFRSFAESCRSSHVSLCDGA